MKELIEALNKLAEVLAPYDEHTSKYVRRAIRKPPQEIANDLSIWGGSGSIMDQGAYGCSFEKQSLFNEAALNLGSVLMNSGCKNPRMEMWIHFFEKSLNGKPTSMDWAKLKLENLTAREIKVLKEKFGNNFAKSQDFEEIGKQFDITRERIRQIEEKALRKLRNRKGDYDPDAE